jgi:hypothetical protein
VPSPSSPQERVRRIYSTGVTDVVHPAGFRRKGTVWTLAVHEDVKWLVQMQKGSYNTSDSVTFRPFFAVLVPRLTDMLAFDIGESYSAGAILGNFAEVGPRLLRFVMRRNSAYTVKLSASADEDERIAVKLRRQLQEDVLPFLDGFRSPTDVLHYLDSKQRGPALEPIGEIRLVYVAALCAITGDYERGHQRLDAFLASDPTTEVWRRGMDRIRLALEQRG